MTPLGTTGIENSLHPTLDVTFNEDNSMKRAGNAAENFCITTKADSMP
jgi:predicted transposase YbfD/YdcC